MGVGSALSCQGWGFLSLAWGGSGVPKRHRVPKGGSDPRAGSEKLDTRWAQESWGLWGWHWGWQRGQGTGWQWGWWRDSGDMGGFLGERGEDRVMLGVAEGLWGCPQAKGDWALGFPQSASGVPRVSVPCGPAS